MSSMRKSLKKVSYFLCFCCLFFLLEYCGWSQYTAWTVWVVYPWSKPQCSLYYIYTYNIYGYFLEWPTFCVIPLLIYLTVDCTEIPQYSYLCGHMQGVLWGLCHLQLHDLLAKLPGKSISQPGVDARGPGAAETPASSLLLPTLANGRVSLL